MMNDAFPVQHGPLSLSLFLSKITLSLSLTKYFNSQMEAKKERERNREREREREREKQKRKRKKRRGRRRKRREVGAGWTLGIQSWPWAPGTWRPPLAACSSAASRTKHSRGREARRHGRGGGENGRTEQEEKQNGGRRPSVAFCFVACQLISVEKNVMLWHLFMCVRFSMKH